MDDGYLFFNIEPVDSSHGLFGKPDDVFLFDGPLQLFFERGKGFFNCLQHRFPVGAPAKVPGLGRVGGQRFRVQPVDCVDELPQGNRVALGEEVADQITAEGKHVVIIGGGDTGADCLGTAHRQGALSVTQLEIMPAPPGQRDAASNPWPTYPMVMRVSSAHEEGGERLYSVNTERFVGDDGNVRALLIHDVERVDGRFQKVEGTERELPADLVFLAMGFTGAQRTGLVEALGVDLDQRGNISRDGEFMSTVPGVFVAGDMGRGQSLIVWAIAEGRAAAGAVDTWLTGSSMLPRPVTPTAVALR